MYLCVDCGGSKTSVVVCDASGKIIGRSHGGPSNFAYLTLEAFESVVRLTVSDALKTCTSPPSADPVALPPAQPLSAAWFGVSGVDSPAAIESITPILSKILGIPQGPRLIVGNDTELLAAPVRSLKDVSYAVTVVAGTGSIAVSFEEVNGTITELARIGGWGWILGDEGGGFHVGRQAICQLLLEHDTASVSSIPVPESILRKRILEHFSVSSVLELLTAIHMPEPEPLAAQAPEMPSYLLLPREKRLSSLAPLVFKLAFEDGDPLALKILETCSRILADEIAVLCGDKSEEKPKLVKAQESVISFGGSLAGIEGYRKMILDRLAEKGHVFKYVEFVDDAAATGAVSLSLSFKSP